MESWHASGTWPLHPTTPYQMRHDLRRSGDMVRTPGHACRAAAIGISLPENATVAWSKPCAFAYATAFVPSVALRDLMFTMKRLPGNAAMTSAHVGIAPLNLPRKGNVAPPSAV